MSTFTDKAQLPVSKKIILFEMDLGQLQSFWVNWRAGMWYLELDRAYATDIIISDDLISNISPIIFTRIGSVQKDAVNLTNVTSTATVLTTEDSFYFDETNQILYVHLDNWDEPSMYSMVIGEVEGYANFGGVYGDLLYEGRINSIPSISKSRDSLYYGRMSFGGGQVGLINEDGKFNEWGERFNLFGQEARLLMGFDDMAYADFEKIYTGYMEKVSIGRDDMKITLADPRKRFSRLIPNKSFTLSDYPNLKASNEGKTIPIAYGALLNVPATCTNEEEATSTFTFKLADTTYHSINAITTVYVTTSATRTVTPSSTNLLDASFTLTTANYGTGNTVSVDMTGYEYATGTAIQNGLDIIEDLLLNYMDINYNANLFDTTEWASANALARDTSIFIDQPKEIYRAIEDISNSVYGKMIVKRDGKYSFRLYNPLNAHSQVVDYSEIMNRPILDYDPEETLTSVRVGYNKDWSAGSLQFYNYDDKEDAIFEKFRIHQSKDYESLLIASADSLALAKDIMEIRGDAIKTFNVVTKMQSIDREVGDWVFVELNREDGPMVLDIITWAEVTGINQDLNNNQVTLTCQKPKRQRLDGGDAPHTNNDIVDGGDATLAINSAIDILNGEDAA